MVERAEIQQAAVALHLGTLKSAGDAGQVIFRLGSALQDGSFVQIQLHIAVQPQSTGHVDARR